MIRSVLRRVRGAALAALVLGLLALSAQADPATKEWEYKVVRGDHYPTEELLAKFLNTLGAEGWELVAVSDAHDGSAGQTKTRLILKRPR